MRFSLPLVALVLAGAAVQSPSRTSSAPIPSVPPLGDASPSARIIESAAEVRALSPEEAAQGHAVRLDGIALFNGAQHSYGVLVDASAGVFLTGVADPRVTFGTSIRVEGVTRPGDFAPVVAVKHWELAEPKLLPTPRPSTYADIATGTLDSQWIEVKGIVREVTRSSPNRVNLVLQLGDGRLTARWAPVKEIESADLVGSVVRMRGVCCSLFKNREFQGPWLMCPDLENLTVVEKAPASPFGLPVRSIASLLHFDVNGFPNRQVHVRGIVLAVQPGAGFFLRDASRAIPVRATSLQGLEAGMEVNVVAFPSVEASQPVLDHARWQASGKVQVPQPLKLVVDRTLEDRLNNNLVTAEGTLLDRSSDAAGWLLFVNIQGYRVIVRLPHGDGGKLPSNGSLLQVTGVWQGDLKASWPKVGFRPDSFQLLLRGPDDISVLKRAPWWTSKRLAQLAAFSIAAAALGALWSFVLRRRNRVLSREIRARAEAELALKQIQADLEAEVARRTAELERQSEAFHKAETEAAILRERSRLASDLHDTLEQSLMGVALQLESSTRAFAPEPDLSRKHIEVAKSLLARTRADAKRSVWDLRSEALDRKNLADVIDEIAANLSDGNACTITVEKYASTARLPEDIEKHVQRVAQEALANALKHGNPRHISVHLGFNTEDFTMRIHDDGTGFDLKSSPGVADGHLGITSMRERIHRIGGHFSLVSQAGQGTELTVRIPHHSPYPPDLAHQSFLPDQNPAGR